MKEQLAAGLAALSLPGDGIPALCRYAELLLETNRVMNLTAITDPAAVAARCTFWTALALLKLWRTSSGKHGGGRRHRRGLSRPGAAHCWSPPCGMTLLDSLGKRVTFLRDRLRRSWGWPTCACVHARAEEFAAHRAGVLRPRHLSRAVAALPTLCGAVPAPGEARRRSFWP
jgi:16S rRNA (guanine527-N7)-methyltransferase